MTKLEFEAEVKRVLVALGLDAKMPIDIKERSASQDLPATFGTQIQGEGCQFSIGRYGPFLRLQIADDMTGLRDTGSMLFSEFPMRLSSSVSHKKYAPLMLRVLLHLGYDINPFCEQIGVMVTAHEHLEWLLWLKGQEEK